VTGVVDWAGPGASNGNYVSIDVGGGTYYDHLHLNAIAQNITQYSIVHAGDRIGDCGHTGNAGTDHLHLRVKHRNPSANYPACNPNTAGFDYLNPQVLLGNCTP
jgi:murein DD-endopeptidase MepM/ murein hydrolase activator NlpD